MKPLFFFLYILFFPVAAFSQETVEGRYETYDLQKNPAFPGGQEALDKFMADNVYYTRAAHKQNLQGTVVLTFVVEKDGSLSGIKVLKDIGGGLGEIAACVLQASPKWTPGEANGNPVKVKLTLPVQYRLGSTKVKSKLFILKKNRCRNF